MKKIIIALFVLALGVCAVQAAPAPATAPQSKSAAALSPGTKMVCNVLNNLATKITNASSEQEVNKYIEQMGESIDGAVIESKGKEVLTSADKAGLKNAFGNLFDKMIVKIYKLNGMTPTPEQKAPIINALTAKLNPVVDNAVRLEDLGKLGEVQF